MNVLVIAPHPDDESIGCGGTICLHTDRGDRGALVFLTSGESGLRHMPPAEAWRVRESEAAAAAEILGIASVTFLRQPDGHLGDRIQEVAAALQPILECEQPQLVYLPHAREAHSDHRASLPILQAAFRGVGMPAPTLLGYEVWTALSEYDCLEDVSTVMSRKLRAIRAHRSQVEQLHYDRAARGLNQYRGAVAQCRYAEVFEVAGLPLDVDLQRRRTNPWWHLCYRSTQEIIKLIPPQDTFILVDEDQLGAEWFVAPRRCIPFLEKDGRYWGKPRDDETAIRELERLRESGASSIVFAWPAFWWLDYYSGMRRYLELHFCRVQQSERLVVFDLEHRNENEWASEPS